MSTERPSKRKELPDVLPEDPKERKRIQNRIAQRKYRQKQQERLAELEGTLSTRKENQRGSSSASSDESNSPNSQGSGPDLETRIGFLESQLDKYTKSNAQLANMIRITNTPFSFPDEQNFFLETKMGMQAMVQNGFALAAVFPTIIFDVVDDDSISPLCIAMSKTNLGGNCDVQSTRVKVSNVLPEDLVPTELQETIEHHPWLDLLPWPAVRDRILSFLPLIDEDDLCRDLHRDPGFRVWGSIPWSHRSWEVSESFLEKWWFLLDRQVVRDANFWRQQRGLKQLKLPCGPTLEEARIQPI